MTPEKTHRDGHKHAPKNRFQLALAWFDRSEEHLKNCDDENCEWYWAFADFKKKYGGNY